MGDYNFKKAWHERLTACEKTWVCHKCHRYCPNCAGRSCLRCCVKKLQPGFHLFTEEEVKDTSRLGLLNPGSLSHTTKAEPSHFSVHPNWNSEVQDNLHINPKPLMRPPWPWEQPRYEPNNRLPSTYVSPAQYREDEELAMLEEDGRQHNYGVEVPPLSYHLTQYYKTTHPNYIPRY